jgi:hypothetical protein
VCISYDIPKLETCGTEKLSRKRNLEGEEAVGAESGPDTN